MLASLGLVKYESEFTEGRKLRELGPLLLSGVEGAMELELGIRCLPGLEGYSRGPLGTLILSRNVLFRRWVKLGARSRLPRMADAGMDGLRKPWFEAVSDSLVVVRWNFRRTRFASAMQ